MSIDIQKKKNLSILSNIFRHARCVSVRDTHSYDILHTLNISSDIEKDPVFFDAHTFPKNTTCLQNIPAPDWHISLLERLDISGKTVGIAFRSGYLPHENASLQAIVQYITSKDARILFLPHSFHDTDKKANDYTFLSSFCTHPYTSITKNMQQTYDAYV